MTTRRILGGVLLVAVLLTIGCGGSGSEPKTPEDHVRSAIDGLKANQSLDNVRTDIQQAIAELKKERESKNVTEAREKLTAVEAKLTENLDDNTKRKIVADLESVLPNLHSDSNSPSLIERFWGPWVSYALWILGGIVVAFLLVSAVMYIWKRAWRNVEINVARVVTAHMGSERKAQPDFTDKLTSLSSAQKEINSNLNDLHTEVRTLARMVRESLADRNDRRPTPLPPNYSSQSDGSTLKTEEPEFPVSVNDYLGKMSRYANAVKLDFQNGILVNDPDNKDELFLIRDSRVPDDGKPLFLVPGAAQFHNKQDFEIYYAKYYNCPRPQMGDVWIIGPAVVEKVPGGWQLREKGMLEVR